MSLTRDQHAVHERYERFAPKVKLAIDRAFKQTQAVLRNEGLIVANDDRAEALVCAIVEYVEESARP